MAEEEGDPEPINQYRHCKLATSLMDALEELIDTDKLPPELGFSVMQKAVLAGIEAKADGKLVIKGGVETYRFVDQVWQFKTSEVKLNYSIPSLSFTATPLIITDPIVVICQDARLRPGQED